MAQVKINLLPPRVRQARARRAMIAIGATVGIAVLTLPLGLLYVKWAAVASLRQQVRRVDEESKAFAGVIDKIRAIDTQEAALVKNLDVLDKLTGRQATWIRFLELLNASQSAAHDLWLTNVASKVLAGADAGKVEVTLTGVAFSIGSIDTFVRALAASDPPVQVTKVTGTGTVIGRDGSQQFVATLRMRV